MIAQLISFFLPKNSQNSTPSCSCCYTGSSMMTENSVELPYSSVASPLSKVHSVDDLHLQRRVSFDLAQDHRRINARVSKIALSSIFRIRHDIRTFVSGVGIGCQMSECHA
jgi:hypothetical protein